jgi:hypothetical protein
VYITGMKAALLLLLFLTTVNADTLTLTTGEKLTGEIVAETPHEYQLRLANDDFTIIHVRPIPATNVVAVLRDTPEQKTARQDYETICRYRLHPDLAQPVSQCKDAVAFMENYLAGHPDPRVRAKLAAWQTELANVSKGLVKFQNRWMTPAEKQTAVHLAYRQAQLQATQNTIAQLQRQIATLNAQFSSLTNSLVIEERDLVLAEYELSQLRDFIQPEYSYRPVGGSPQGIIYGNHYFVWSPAYWEKYVSGEKVTVHPARASCQQRVRDRQLEVSSYREQIQTTSEQLTALRQKLSQTETALAGLRK